jgi:hypothetical protein
MFVIMDTDSFFQRLEVERPDGADPDAERAVVAEPLVQYELEGVHAEREGMADRGARGAGHALAGPDPQPA